MRPRPLALLPLLALASGLAVAGCGKEGSVYQSGTFKVSSPAFPPGGKIPKAHAMTPAGQNVSPPLEWSGAPSNTKSFALIVDDPDAGVPPFVHWVIWKVPGTAKGLPDGIPADVPTPSVAGGPAFAQGKNEFGRLGWGGPQPPEGETHQYAFSVYALDADPALEPGASAAQLVEAMKGHVLATARMIAKYP